VIRLLQRGEDVGAELRGRLTRRSNPTALRRKLLSAGLDRAAIVAGE
jgi:hypothetical protein